MRIAVLADIHGNSIALDAVLADIQTAGGVDAYWILGDLVAIGHDPVGTLERLAALPNTLFIEGNTDHFVTSGTRPYPTIEDAQANPRLIPLLQEVAGSFAWTQGCLTRGGWLNWLDKLPFDHRLILPDGTRVLLVHAAPGKNDGDGLHLASSDAEIAAAVAGCEADLVMVGHTHCTFDRSVDNIRVINPGRISNSLGSDLRASYVMLDSAENSYSIEFRRVDYDRQAVIAALKHLRYPGAPYVIGFMEGRVQSAWLRKWLAMQSA